MTDLERKLAEALRGQAEEVTPNLDAAWAEQMRRQRKPLRRRLTVLIAPLAAVLVVLTSVLLATQLNNDPAPAQPADRIEALSLAKFVPIIPMKSLQVENGPVALTDFVGQSDTWTAYAFSAFQPGVPGGFFCVAAVPVGQPLTVNTPLYGTKTPQCVSTDNLPSHGVRAGYVGEFGGPLPPGKAVYFMDPTVRALQLFAPNGDMTEAHSTGKRISESMVFVADVVPGAEPVRCRVIWGPLSSPLTNPASR
ncbi:Uncharacterised protein [Amycolatopsis camponoti]|uniref:Uncharacterized protein n=1 Tax=Amycolatopsis camponoti TaxID=2606593 RepID=A0A6I8M3D8_9PSEU|nr:hypothetical protein [Amycolatopsis camponoti]VVJ23407.1 Uncharacterised protein [Amycolatopsis camponoti]